MWSRVNEGKMAQGGDVGVQWGQGKIGKLGPCKLGPSCDLNTEF